jgi:hypothetical protein
MKRTKHEATLPGNPHSLPINQHIFPAKSIKRFAEPDGKVGVRLLAANVTKRLPSDASIFCLKRAWDYRTENFFTKRIEDAFQTLADQIVACPDYRFSAKEQHDIRLFLALWHFRAHFAPPAELKLRGVLDGNAYTKEQEEKLEKSGYSFFREDGTVPPQQIAGPVMRVRMGQFLRVNKDLNWGIVQSENDEFLVPDIPSYGVIPVLPTLCLYPNTQNAFVSDTTVAHLNGRALRGSDRYVFANDLLRCPIRFA